MYFARVAGYESPPRITTMRTARYAGLLPCHLFDTMKVLIVGCGAFGRPVALRLAQMGIGNLTLVDPDIVSVENLGPQGFIPADIGKPKVEVIARDILALLPEAKVTAIQGTWECHSTYAVVEEGADDIEVPHPNDYTHIISASDSMACRTDLFDYFRTSPIQLFIDNRMAAETFRLFTVTHRDEDLERYVKTLFPDSEASPQPCSARSTAYCPDMSCCLALSAIMAHLRAREWPFEMAGNLIEPDIYVAQR